MEERKKRGRRVKRKGAEAEVDVPECVNQNLFIYLHFSKTTTSKYIIPRMLSPTKYL